MKPDPSAKNLPDLVFVVQFHDPTGPGQSVSPGEQST